MSGGPGTFPAPQAAYYFTIHENLAALMAID